MRRVAKKIKATEVSSKQVQAIIQKMLKKAYGEQKSKRKSVMVGLAAPQIGISKRIILVDIASDGRGKVGNLKVFINPEITWKSKKQNEWYEGCYSISKLCGIVSRPTSIKITALNLKMEEKYTGYVARIFQHEIDHLNGKLFVDKILNPNHLHLVEKDDFPLYRDQEAWRNWPKKYPLPLASLRLVKV